MELSSKTSLFTKSAYSLRSKTSKKSYPKSNKSNKSIYPRMKSKLIGLFHMSRHSTQKKPIYWFCVTPWPKLKPKPKINLGLDSKFNSIHFVVTINKYLKFLGLKISDFFENLFWFCDWVWVSQITIWLRIHLRWSRPSCTMVRIWIKHLSVNT